MGRMWRTAAMLVVMLAAGACASSGPTATTFGPTSQGALLVLAGPRYGFAANTGFRRVDLAAQTFGTEYEGFGTGIVGGQINAEGPVYFNTREVVPGDYALVSLLAVTGATVWTCMGSRAPVFSLRPGSVTIIRTDAYWTGMRDVPRPNPVSDEAVLAAFETTRAAYPDLVGHASIATPTATLRWEPGGMGMTRNCSEPSGFEQVR